MQLTMHASWRHLLPELLRQGSYRTQSALVQAITQRAGRDIDQATVSRQLKALGAHKVDGVYRLPDHTPSATPMPDRVRTMKVTAGGCMVVVHTQDFFASVVANAVDNSGLPGILGTIAGDNCVFVATSGPDAVPGLRALLGQADPH